MTILDEFNRDPDGVLDRLVDGELSPHQRRELLAALDDEPGGWRRCALAFLEAQTWRWQFSRVAAEPILAQLSAAAPRSRAKTGALWGGGLLALAASLAIAFALGTRFPTTGPAAGALAKSDAKTTDPQPDSSRGIAEHRNYRPPGVDDTGDPAVDATEEMPWQTVMLTPVGGSGEPIELRVEPGEASSPLVPKRSALSGLLSHAFERAGWQVDRRQGVVPIDLSDGRQLVVPIEEVDFKSPDSVQF